MGLVSLLFSFNGRINRLQYWLGGMGAGVAIFMLVFMLVLMGGATAPTLGKEQQLAHFITMFALVLIPALSHFLLPTAAVRKPRAARTVVAHAMP